MVQTELCYRCLTYFHRASRWISVYKKITLRGTRRHTVDTVDFPRRSFHDGVNKTRVAYCTYTCTINLMIHLAHYPITQICQCLLTFWRLISSRCNSYCFSSSSLSRWDCLDWRSSSALLYFFSSIFICNLQCTLICKLTYKGTI